MPLFAGFGEERDGYPVRVLNEREARAGAGILLVFGLIAFSNAFLKGDFLLTRIAIVVFGIDFFFRVAVDHRFAPSLVLGRYMVSKQQPDFVGAAPKRFAWSLGLAIAAVMAVWIIGLNLAGPVAILGCLTCIVLLFFESAFGICIGCKIHAAFWPDEVRLCPGGACEIGQRDPVTRVSAAQFAAVALVLSIAVLAAPFLSALPSPRRPGAGDQARSLADCVVPEFAKLIGHEEQWKLHNGCT